jgi:hypothetical protein
MTKPTNAKPVISEMRVAAQFCEHILRKAQTDWPTIYQTFRQTLGEKFRVEDESMAVFDLALAATALDMQAVKNLFSADQAKRIERWVERLKNTEDWGDYAIAEIRAYDQHFQDAMARVESDGDPLSAMSVRLLYRWLGDNLQEFDFRIGSEKTDIISPILIEITHDVLLDFVGVWKTISQQYDLVEEDLPFETDWEAYGVYELGKYPNETKPDGTIIYRDERGRLEESWISPKKFMKLVSQLGAKRTGTVCRVLVKGPWPGVKETRLGLSDQSVSAFADRSGLIYALCVFKKGQAGYRLMKKDGWDNLDRIIAIMADPNLSEAKRAAAMKHFSNA